MNEVTIAFLFRGINMMLVTLGGLLSIYLGWKLYRDGIDSAVESEMQHGDNWKFTMKALGPGVFFALFGMWILVTVIGKEVSTESRSEPVEVEEISGEGTDAGNAAATSRPPEVDVKQGTEKPANGEPTPSSKKVSLWPGLITQARAQTVKRTRVCMTYNRTVSYDGDTIVKQDFQTAIDDAIIALRAGEFDPKTQKKATHAIAILARLSSANGGSVQ